MPPFISQPKTLIPKTRNLDVSGFAEAIKSYQDKQRIEGQNQNAADILQQADYGAPVVEAFRGGDRGLAGMLMKQAQLKAQQQAQVQGRDQQNKFRMMQIQRQDRRHSETMDLRRQEMSRNGELKALNMRILQNKLRGQQLKQQGITPKSIAANKEQTKLESEISAGIENLVKIPKWAENRNLDFNGAIGPFDNSYVGRALSLGDPAEGEIRRRIAGDVEALAAAVKPYIRKPGEGPWTDADQTRLVAVVGDLKEARNQDEYNRALSNVRDRLNANFGMKLPKLSFEGGGLDDLKGKVDPQIFNQAQDAIARGADPAKVRARITGGR